MWISGGSEMAPMFQDQRPVRVVDPIRILPAALPRDRERQVSRGGLLTGGALRRDHKRVLAGREAARTRQPTLEGDLVRAHATVEGERARSDGAGALVH